MLNGSSVCYLVTSAVKLRQRSSMGRSLTVPKMTAGIQELNRHKG